MSIKFYSYFDIACLMRELVSKDVHDNVYYFDISFPAVCALKLLKKSNKIKLFDFNLWQVKGSDGEGSYYPRIYGDDVIEVCDELDKSVFSDSFFVDYMKFFSDETTEKGDLFFRKDAAHKINDIVVFINVVAWYSENMKIDKGTIELSVENSLFFNALKSLSHRHGVILTSYFSFRSMVRYLYLLFGNIYLSSLACAKSFFTTAKHSKVPRVSSLYTLRGLNFDLTKRNDFPWLLLSGIDREKVIIYFDRKDMPLIEDMAQILRKEGIKPLALSREATTSDKVEVYSPTCTAAKKIIFLGAKAASLIVAQVIEGNFMALLYLPEAIHFVRSYSVAYDFYKTNGIRVDVDFVDFDPYRVARRMSLASCGGVSISYQLSNWPIANVILGSSADAYFLFGPYYKEKLIKSGTRNKSLVMSGFLTDYSFSRVKEKSAKLRKRLLDNGAKFIICYFDENSLNSRMSIIPNSRSQEVYRYLFNWVLRDKSIGLICSPKRPQTLSSRLGQVNDLMQQVKDTGRCIFTDGEYAAANYPTEVGQAADVVVSLLIGGTTSLENFLSGKRVVYLDLEGLYGYPEYINGKNKIVFSDLDSLTQGVERYRSNPNGFDEFGSIKLSPGIGKKDPFCDGNSAQRMGEYINSLIKEFGDGKTRKEAMAYADGKYADDWGKEWVSNGNN